jgi:diguanylate cyclase (GGDEF)-like protein/PAS domain S-box-containing protein
VTGTATSSVTIVVVAGAILLMLALVLARTARLIGRLERSVRREKALRSAGASLLTATDRTSIYRATMEAVSVLASDASARLLVQVDGEADRYEVVAASQDADVPPGRRVRLPMTDEMRVRLLEERVVARPAGLDMPAELDLPADGLDVLMVPVGMHGSLEGLLIVGGNGPLAESARDGLDVLSSQVALALESAVLTEDLLRRQSEERFFSLVQNSSDVVMVVDADSTVRWTSPSVERVLGYPPAELNGTTLTAIVHPEDAAGMLQFLALDARSNDVHPTLTECRLRHREGFWLHVETLRTNLLHDPAVRGIVLNTRDVSERKAFEEQLAHQAFHDPITGLANRALFRDRVEHALERQLRDDRPVSVLIMDLDDFKTINDSLGHAVGDMMLAEVGERLKSRLRAADTAARLGGDEFAVLLEDGGEGLGAADVATRILEALDGPFDLEGKVVFCRASIGIATADQDHDAPGGAEELLRNADVAMYMAKESGKNRYQIFEPAMHDTALKRLELKADLQRALDNGEFVLHYQPVIQLETGNISGLEALLRWQHPERGLIPPLDFIPLAEETGLIIPIGNWVLCEATQQARALQERYPATPPLHMAVNLSARQLQRPEIVAEVSEALMRSGLAAGDLVLEITESIMMQDIELSLQRLTELKEVGVRLAVDDFGTGYSSLNYIQQFPVDILKVDKSFIDAFNQDARKSALTATIIKLAADLDLSPVAEGIERADQLEQLLQLHCDLGQGYYFAKPLPLDGIDDLLTTRRTLSDRDAELSS